MHDVAVSHKDVVESEEVREELEIAYQSYSSHYRRELEKYQKDREQQEGYLRLLHLLLLQAHRQHALSSRRASLLLHLHSLLTHYRSVTSLLENTTQNLKTIKTASPGTTTAAYLVRIEGSSHACLLSLGEKVRTPYGEGVITTVGAAGTTLKLAYGLLHCPLAQAVHYKIVTENEAGLSLSALAERYGGGVGTGGMASRRHSLGGEGVLALTASQKAAIDALLSVQEGSPSTEGLQTVQQPQQQQEEESSTDVDEDSSRSSPEDSSAMVVDGAPASEDMLPDQQEQAGATTEEVSSEETAVLSSAQMETEGERSSSHGVEKDDELVAPATTHIHPHRLHCAVEVVQGTEQLRRRLEGEMERRDWTQRLRRLLLPPQVLPALGSMTGEPALPSTTIASSSSCASKMNPHYQAMQHDILTGSRVLVYEPEAVGRAFTVDPSSAIVSSHGSTAGGGAGPLAQQAIAEDHRLLAQRRDDLTRRVAQLRKEVARRGADVAALRLGMFTRRVVHRNFLSQHHISSPLFQPPTQVPNSKGRSGGAATSGVEPIVEESTGVSGAEGRGARRGKASVAAGNEDDASVFSRQAAANALLAASVAAGKGSRSRGSGAAANGGSKRGREERSEEEEQQEEEEEQAVAEDVSAPPTKRRAPAKRRK
eukprot:gene4777-5235_t